MNAILLIGGQGTRLRPLTLTQPKALLPVFNKPFIRYQLDLLKAGGITDVILASGPFVRNWEKTLKKFASPGFTIHFAYEPTPYGTGGAIRFAYDVLKKKTEISEDPVLVINGDIFVDFDLKKFVQFHKDKKSEGTILLTEVEDPTRFGVVSLMPSGRVRRFIEKPKDASYGRLINAGAYLLEPFWIEKIPQRKIVSVERETFPLALKSGARMHGYKMKGYWSDIGTPQTYLNAHLELARITSRFTSDNFFRKSNKILLDPSVRRGKKVIFEGVVCCGRGVFIGDSVVIRNSVVLEGSRLERGTVVEKSIVGRFCRIGENSQIGEGTVLGDKTALPPFTRC